MSDESKRREDLTTAFLVQLIIPNFVYGNGQTCNVDMLESLSLGERAKMVHHARLWADLVIETCKETEGKTNGADVVG